MVDRCDKCIRGRGLSFESFSNYNRCFFSKFKIPFHRFVKKFTFGTKVIFWERLTKTYRITLCLICLIFIFKKITLHVPTFCSVFQNVYVWFQCFFCRRKIFFENHAINSDWIAGKKETKKKIICRSNSATTVVD